MSKAIEWFKIKIRGLELTWSDLFLAIGFITFVPFAALSWLFMVTSDPTDIPFTPWMMITCFSISVIAWGLYFYLEFRKGAIKNNAFLWIYILFAILSIVSVLIQPSDFHIDVIVRYVGDLTPEGYNVGDVYPLYLQIPWVHKMFFAFGSLLITTVFYILYIVFPKRLKNMDFLIFMGICVFVFLVVLATYSYIVERDRYLLYFDAIKRGDIWEMQVYAPKSFIVHRVPYGACMFLGIIFGLVLHGLNKKWYWIFPIIFCYINLLLSFCKTSLIIATITLVVYLVCELIRTYKKHKIRNLIIGSSLLIAALVSLVLFLISVFTKGAFLFPFYKIFGAFTNNQTLMTRTFIWRNVETELQNGWWLIGRGFGTHNFILYRMNIINSDPLCPSHSTYYAVLGAGGVPNLIGLLGIYAYFGYLFYNCFKFNKLKTIGLSIGFFAFFFYTFTEGVNYLIAFFVVPLAFYHTLIKNGFEKNSNRLRVPKYC